MAIRVLIMAIRVLIMAIRVLTMAIRVLSIVSRANPHRTGGRSCLYIRVGTRFGGGCASEGWGSA